MLAKIILTLILGLNAYSQSFDCKKASSLSEKTICGSDELKVLDSKLAEVYKEKLAKSEGAQILRNEQREWLKKARDCASDAACLKASYVNRLSALGSAIVNSAVSPKSVVEAKGKIEKKVISREEKLKCWQRMKNAVADLVLLANEGAECNEASPFFDLATERKTGKLKVRIHFILYDWDDKSDPRKEIISPFVSIDEIRKYFSARRSQTPIERLLLRNGDTLESQFDSIILRTTKGSIVELASPELYFEEQMRGCRSNQGLEDLCEETVKVTPRLNWIFNDLFSIQYILEWAHSRFYDSRNLIFKRVGNKFEKSEGIKDIIQESVLLQALKSDLVIRNSNILSLVSGAKTVEQFFSLLPKKYDSPIFRSHSNRLNPEKQKIANSCASAFDDAKSTDQMRGMNCLKKNKIILYDYSISKAAFIDSYTISKVSPKSINVDIPFGGRSIDEGGIFHANVPIENSSYVYYVSADYVEDKELRMHRINFGPNNILIDASVPPLMQDK